MKRLIRALALILLPLTGFAQAHHEIGLTAGVANYYGDLQTEWFPKYGYKPMGGIIYKYFMSPHIGLRFGATFTQLSAADSLSDIPVHVARNLSFSTNLFEVHGGIEVNLLPIDIDRMKVTPYVFGGVAVFYYNPYASAPNGDKVYLRPLSTEGQGLSQYPDRKQYSLVNVAFPVGGGLKFLIGKTILLTGEMGFRYCATDYLDDVSRSYVNLDTLGSVKGAQAQTLSFRGNEATGWDGNYKTYKDQRGDYKANDWYWFGSVSVAVYFRAFGNMREYMKTKCPTFLRGRAKNYNR